MLILAWFFWDRRRCHHLIDDSHDQFKIGWMEMIDVADADTRTCIPFSRSWNSVISSHHFLLVNAGGICFHQDKIKSLTDG